MKGRTWGVGNGVTEGIRCPVGLSEAMYEIPPGV